MTGITVRPLATPSSWDGDDAAARDLRATIDMRNAANRHDRGDALLDVAYEEGFALATQAGPVRMVQLVAERDGEIVGRAVLEMSTAEALHIGDCDILVAPHARRTGVGSALWDAAEQRLAEEGRTTIQAWVHHAAASGPLLEAPTGFGAVPADAPEVRFLTERGFSLRQVNRMSELRVGDAESQLAERRAAAAAAAEGYEVLAWTGRTPAELADSLAALTARMSTDAPSADLDHEEERWDAERLREYEETQLRGGRSILRAAARQRSTGALVAYTTLVVPSDPRAPAHQHDTLVHAAHRGHRLGMLVKTENLLRLLAEHPGRDRVVTWNAEENRPMLSVNEDLGFRAVGYEGAWQRVGG